MGAEANHSPGPTLPALTRPEAGQAREQAVAAGFAEAGVAALPYANEARDAGRFREWVGAGRGSNHAIGHCAGSEAFKIGHGGIENPVQRFLAVEGIVRCEYHVISREEQAVTQRLAQFLHIAFLLQ